MQVPWVLEETWVYSECSEKLEGMARTAMTVVPTKAKAHLKHFKITFGDFFPFVVICKILSHESGT